MRIDKKILQSIRCIKSLPLKFIISIYLKIAFRYREDSSITGLNKIFHLSRSCKNTIEILDINAFQCVQLISILRGKQLEAEDM